MQIQLIRNATVKLSFASRTILVDPTFGAGAPRRELDALLSGADIVILPRLREDEALSAAAALRNHRLQVLCPPAEAQPLRDAGVAYARPLVGALTCETIEVSHRCARQRSAASGADPGPVMGFCLEARGEPSLFWAADTAIYPGLDRLVRATRPDVLIVHPDTALWEAATDGMDGDDVIEICQRAPWASVVAIGLGASGQRRAELRSEADATGVPVDQLLIPTDGQTLWLDTPPAAEADVTNLVFPRTRLGELQSSPNSRAA